MRYLAPLSYYTIHKLILHTYPYIYTYTYTHRNKEHPCFGATTGLTPEEWWYDVVLQTYLTTENLKQINPDEMRSLMPAVFQMLFYEVFSTPYCCYCHNYDLM